MSGKLAEDVRYRTIAQDDGSVLLQERTLIRRGGEVVFEEPWREETVYADDPLDDLSPHQKVVAKSARKAAMVDLATRPPEDEVPEIDPVAMAPAAIDPPDWGFDPDSSKGDDENLPTRANMMPIEPLETP